MAGFDVEKYAQNAQDQSLNVQCAEQNEGKISILPKLSKSIIGNPFGPLLLYFKLLTFEATWKDIVLMVVGSICATASGVPFPIMGIVFGELIDDMNGATCEASSLGSSMGFENSIDKKVHIMLYIGVAAFSLIYVYVTCWSTASHRLAQRLRERYFERLLHQDPVFFDEFHAGGVSSRLHGDIQAIQSGTSEKVGVFMSCSAFFVTAFIIAFIKVPQLAGMLVSVVPAFLLMAVVGGHFIQKFAGQMSEAVSSASSIASEALNNVALVQVLGANTRLETKFAGYMAKAEKAGIRKGAVTASQAGLLYFVAYSANSLAFWEGSRKIVEAIRDPSKGNSIGDIYTVVFIIVEACVFLGSVAPLFALYGNAASAFGRLCQEMHRPVAINKLSVSDKPIPSHAEASIELRNVTFEYPSRSGQPVLRDVSLKFLVGKYTAIVGASGSGKSTVASLITRLYDPIQGSILYGGHDIKDLDVQSLRSNIGMIQQEPSLLDRSILENIAVGLLNSPDPAHAELQELIKGPQLVEAATRLRTEKTEWQTEHPAIARIITLVEDAARLADAYDFITKMEHGFATQAGANGNELSGGQKQRVALARALIRDPKILLLDEATSALDSSTERRIQSSIEKAAENRTVISIAHRLSTIRNADTIVVMHTGEIVESGSYADLMECGGVFADLAKLQKINSEEKDSASMFSTTTDETLHQSFAKKSSLTVEDTEKPAIVSENKSTKKAQEFIMPKESGIASKTALWPIIKTMSRLNRRSGTWLVAAFSAAIIVGGTHSASGLIFGHTIGALSPCNSTAERILYLGGFFGGMIFMLACVELLANFVSWSSFSVFAEKLLFKVRVLCFRSLLEQGVEWHSSDNRNPTDLLSVISKDTASLGAFSGSIAGTIFGIMVSIIVAIVLSHIIAWRLAIVCLAMVPVLLLTGILSIRANTRFDEMYNESFTNAIKIAVEAVNSIKTVAAFSLETEIFGRYSRALSAPKKSVFVANLGAMLCLTLSVTVNLFINALVYWWGSQLIMRGEYSQTQFFIVVIAMVVSAQLWGSAFTLAPEISRARTAASKIYNLIQLGSSGWYLQKSLVTKDEADANLSEQDVEAASEGKTVKLPSNRGVRVEFQDVHFAYPRRSHITALRGVSFELHAGQFVGLVGPSGAGKSTILTLLQRIYEPTSGIIKVDGRNIALQDPKAYRHDIAIVPQGNTLFDGTIRFNVALGAHPDRPAMDAEVEQACRIANIHDSIAAMPDGYDTECGPNGSRLSGGQRQRLAIARALVRKPRLLLLDESTSALDAESERALQEGLERAAKAITVVAISHRLHTLQRADIIFVVEDGLVVEKGRHAELIERCDSYRVNAQQQMLH